jgi:hypothetical protein
MALHRIRDIAEELIGEPRGEGQQVIRSAEETEAAILAYMRHYGPLDDYPDEVPGEDDIIVQALDRDWKGTVKLLRQLEYG